MNRKQYGVLITTLMMLGTASAAPVPRFDCFIEPQLVTAVSSADEGVLEQLMVRKSDLVTVGDPLFSLDSDVERDTLELIQLRAAMDDEIRSREASYSLALKKLKRIKSLYNRQAVPLHQKEEAETETALARLQLQQAKENQKLAVLEAKRAKTLLDRRLTSSPVSGVVVQLLKFPGEYVEGEPVLQLAQLDPLRVEVILPVALFGKLQPGHKAMIAPELPLQEGPLEATVTIVDKVADVASGTFGVQLELPNPEHRLPSGLKCDVVFKELKLPDNFQQNFGVSE